MFDINVELYYGADLDVVTAICVGIWMCVSASVCLCAYMCVSFSVSVVYLKVELILV